MGESSASVDWTVDRNATFLSTNDPAGQASCGNFQLTFPRPAQMTVNGDTVTANQTGTLPNGQAFSLDFNATASDFALIGSMLVTGSGSDFNFSENGPFLLDRAP